MLLALVPQLLLGTMIFWIHWKQWGALRHLGIVGGPYLRLGAIATALLLAPWPRLLSGRRQLAAFFVLDLLLSIVLFADILYYRQFQDFTSVAALRFAGQLTTVSSSVTDLVRPLDFVVFAGLPLLAALALAPARARAHVLRPLRLWAVLGLVATGAAGLAYVTHEDRAALSWNFMGDSKTGARVGILGYHLRDLGTYAARSASSLLPAEEALARVHARFPSRPPSRSPLAGIARGKSVLVLQVEALQDFSLELQVGGEPVAPNLRRLAAESVRFTNFYAQTGQGNTADADLIGNCSLYPSRTGAVYYDYATNDFRCVPELLKEQGYGTFALQSMPPDFWNLVTVYPAIGFDRYFSKKSFVQDEKLGLALSDRSFLRQAAVHLEAQPRPWYAFLVTMSTHHPFRLPVEKQELKFPPELGSGTTAGYLQCVRYTDGAIGELVERLRAAGTLDDTVLVLYGDHMGIGRGNSDLAAFLGIEPGDEVGLLQAEKRVPFLIRLPGGAGAGERREVAGQLDIAPTLAGLLDLPVDRRWFMGRDLLAEPRGSVAFFDGDAISDERLYLSKDAGSGQGRCLDVPGKAELQPGACTELARHAARELSLSRELVERDLIPKLLAAPR